MMSAYRELKSGEIDTTELDAHVEECAACREALASYAQIGEQVRSAPVFAPPPEMREKLMKALADEQLKFLQKSAPGKVPTPEFLKPYVQERAKETQSQDDIAAFSTAETGPLPIIRARRKRRPVRVSQLGVLGMAAAILIMLMMGGLTSLLMLARSNPTSITRTINSVNRPTEVDQKSYTTTTAYPNVTSALPSGNAVYYTAYGDSEGSLSWMLMEFDRGTQVSKPLLDTPGSDPLIVLSASNSWLVWLEYSRPQTTIQRNWTGDSGHYSPQRAWSLHYLSLLPQSQNTTTSQTPASTKNVKNGQKGSQGTTRKGTPASQTVLSDLPTPILLEQGIFNSDTAPIWVTTPVQGTWLIGDTLLITQIDQKGISHLKSYRLGATGKAAQGQEIARAPQGHVFAWPTANNTGMELYWADEWVSGDGVLHSNIWQQQTFEQAVRYRGHLEEVASSTQKLLMGDGMSFQPQVVDNTLFLLSTSEIKISAQGAVSPNGTPFPTSAVDTSVVSTPRTDTGIYAAPPDASIHGSIFMIPLDGVNVGAETLLGTAGQSTSFQAGSSFIIWQDTNGYQMYDVQRQSDVITGDTLNGAALLVVNGNTTLWLSSTSASGPRLSMMAFNWPN
jgi:hypothetical protein